MEKRGSISILFAVIAIILASSAFAADFSVQQKAIDSEILSNQQAVFQLTITNLGDSTERFFISNARDMRWIYESDPSIDYISGMDIAPSQSKTTTLRIHMLGGAPVGRYLVPLAVFAQDSTVAKEALFDITVIPPTYEPDLKVTVDDVRLAPGQAGDLRVQLTNKNPLVMNNMTLFVQGKLINKTLQFDLAGNQQKSVGFSVEFPKNMPPQTDVLNVIITWKGQVLFNSIAQIDILSSGKALEKEYNLDKGFLRSVETIDLSNPSNTLVQEQITLKTTWLDRMFGTTIPVATLIDVGNAKYYSWTFTVKPEETAQITIVKDFRWAFAIIVLIILLLLLLASSQKALIVRKETVSVRVSEGSMREIKVRILIKNRKPFPVADVRLIDRIPAICKVDREKSALKPARVFVHSEHGQIAEWGLGDFDPGERKEIVYVLESKLGVFGSFDLKPALVKYKKGKSQRKVYSNVVSVGAE